MAIEANVEIVIERTTTLYDSTHRLGRILRRFIEIRGELAGLGQAMTPAQKQAAVQAAQQAMTDIGAATTALQAAWTATQAL
jgi:hypothetical protein